MLERPRLLAAVTRSISIEGVVGNLHPVEERMLNKLAGMTCGFEDLYPYTCIGNFLVTWQRCDNNSVCRFVQRSTELTQLLADWYVRMDHEDRLFERYLDIWAERKVFLSELLVIRDNYFFNYTRKERNIRSISILEVFILISIIRR